MLVIFFIIFFWVLENKILNEDLSAEFLEKFVNSLRVYDAYDKDGVIKLVRMGRDGDGGYVIPEKSLEQAQVLIGYGVKNDISFEEQFSDRYNKSSYGFDCSTKHIEIKNKLTSFIPECISSNNFIPPELSQIIKNPNAGNVTSFTQEMQTYDFNNKKIFIKMDIEGAEYKALPEILQYSKNITGIALELHFQRYAGQFEQAMNLLKSLEKDFILVHLHGNNCATYFFSTNNSSGDIPKILELSYINKNLVESYKISENQSHPTKMDIPCCMYDDYRFNIMP